MLRMVKNRIIGHFPVIPLPHSRNFLTLPPVSNTPLFARMAE